MVSCSKHSKSLVAETAIDSKGRSKRRSQNAIPIVQTCHMKTTSKSIAPFFVCSILPPLSHFSVFLSTKKLDKPPNPTTLINDFSRFCFQRDIPRALEAMNSMEKHRIQTDPISYSELIKCCIASGAMAEGKLVHRHIWSNVDGPKLFLNNMLLSMYVKFNLLDEARNLFDKMVERNVVSWTTMIAAYSNNKINNEALNFLILMCREGVRPNMFTFSSVLRACERLSTLWQFHCSIIKVGLDSDVFVRSALIDIYSKCGELHSGSCVFEEMITGDLVVWNSIIGAFAQNGNGYEALNLFKSMKQAGFPANQATLTSVLRACTGLALVELGRQVHAHILKFKRDLILNNALLDMYCKCGSLEDAYSTFSRMLERDVISWSTMISGLAQNGRSGEALDLFELMKVSGPKPNYITMVGVLFACSHAGLEEDGWHYFRSMNTTFGINPGREHYGCMVDLLGRVGKLDEAIKFIHEMGCGADAVTWKSLLGACRIHQNTDLAIYVAKKILELEPNDGGPYILLSNIYANSQMWEDAAKVRRIMIDKGVRKEPGCSWIEVGKQVHAFLVGDKSHPLMDKVILELKRLIPKIMEAGYFPDTNFVMHDLEVEQKEDSLYFHSEKLAIAFGLMSLSREKPVRIMKNLRICGDCHAFAKLVSMVESRRIVIRDPVRYHHFEDGNCSCGDYW